MHVRVAAVRYLNTAPLIEGLDKAEGLTLLPSVPAAISAMVKTGEADIGLASIVDAVGLAGSEPPGLTLIPAGMIGCDGPTMTVRLFSSVPLNRVEAIHADTDSHTSVILAQVLLHKLHAIRPRIIDFDARERVPLSSAAFGADFTPRGERELSDWPHTVLLIGDKVVTDHPPQGLYPHQLDLGEAWRSLTGLPFVYAMWMCRDQDAGSPNIATAAALLDRQRRRNQARLDWIIRRRAPQARWPLDLASHYLTDLLRFEVGERERRAVSRFLENAGTLGLIAARQPKWSEIDALEHA